MNRVGYLLANRVANRPGYRLGFCNGTESDTYSGAESLTESPHVRAIAARPDPSRPVQTGPVRTRPTIPTREDLSDYPNFAFCRKSRRRARARGAESVEANS